MKALVAAAWVICQVPCTFSSITVRKPFGLIASAGLRNWPPALLTSRSMRPWRSSTPSMSLSTASSSRMSIASNSALPPAPLDLGDHALAAARRGARSRPRWRPARPAPARSRGRCPVPAPETTQTCPSSRPGAKMREVGALSHPRREHMSPMTDAAVRPRDYAARRERTRGGDSPRGPAGGGQRGRQRGRRADRGRPGALSEGVLRVRGRPPRGPQGARVPRRRGRLPGRPGSRLPRPAPDRGPDADRHRAASLGRQGPQPQPGPASGQVLQPRARRRRHLAAARAGASAPATSRSSCSPICTSTTPRRSPSSRNPPSSSASPSGRRRRARGSRCSRATAPPTTTTRSTTAPSTSARTTSTHTGPSAARWTCSATAPCGSPSPPATPRGTCRCCCGLPRRDFVVAGGRRLHLAPARGRPRAMAPRRPPQLAALAARGPGLPAGLPLRPGRPRPRPGVLAEAGLALRGVS